MSIKTFNFCSEKCAEICINNKESELLDSSTDAFSFCANCGNYGNFNNLYDFNVELIEEETCNCGDHIRHNDGGNYHISTYKQI